MWKQAVARTLRNLDAVDEAACAEEASSSECRADGLRFAVGQLVVCLPNGRAGETFSRPGEWSTGRVTQLRPTDLGQQAAYQVVLRHGSYVYPPDDSDLHIREWAPEPGIAGEVQVGMEQADAAWSRAPSRLFSRRNIAAVLSAEETAALLSPVGQELLCVAAEAFDVPVEEGHAYRLLRGFIVRRRAAVLDPRFPLYSPAVIRDVYPDTRVAAGAAAPPTAAAAQNVCAASAARSVSPGCAATPFPADAAGAKAAAAHMSKQHPSVTLTPELLASVGHAQWPLNVRGHLKPAAERVGGRPRHASAAHIRDCTSNARAHLWLPQRP